jgi:hypothetical protein
LAIAGARTNPSLGQALRWSHSIGTIWLGRVIVLLGLVLWNRMPHIGVGAFWIWASLLLWGPVEVAGKRFVAAELKLVRDGGSASGRLWVGALIQLFCIVAIFGLMSAHG